MSNQSNLPVLNPEQDPSRKVSSAHEIFFGRAGVLSRSKAIKEASLRAVMRSIETYLPEAKTAPQPEPQELKPEPARTDTNVFSLESQREKALLKSRVEIEEALETDSGIDVDDIMNRYEDLAA